MPSTKSQDDHAEMDAILKRMLETPPQPHKSERESGEPNPRAAKGRSERATSKRARGTKRD